MPSDLRNRRVFRFRSAGRSDGADGRASDRAPSSSSRRPRTIAAMKTSGRRSRRRRVTDALLRLISIADDLEDDDETRRRKRVGVVAGYLTIVAPLTLPIQAGGAPIAFAIA